MLSKRRKPVRSGIQRAEKREYPAHRKWIRGFSCPVCDADGHSGHSATGLIEGAHVRLGTDGGTGIKPHDVWMIPLCTAHHGEQHRIGEPAFERKYRKAFPEGMRAKALEYAKDSRVPEIREKARKESA